MHRNRRRGPYAARDAPWVHESRSAGKGASEGNRAALQRHWQRPAVAEESKPKDQIKGGQMGVAALVGP